MFEKYSECCQYDANDPIRRKGSSWRDQRGGKEINISAGAPGNDEIPTLLVGIQHPPGSSSSSSASSRCHHDHNLRGDEVGAVLASMSDRSEFWLLTISTAIILNDHNRATHLQILLLPISPDGSYACSNPVLIKRGFHVQTRLQGSKSSSCKEVSPGFDARLSGGLTSLITRRFFNSKPANADLNRYLL